jgi:hypothetical protein
MVSSPFAIWSPGESRQAAKTPKSFIRLSAGCCLRVRAHAHRWAQSSRNWLFLLDDEAFRKRSQSVTTFVASVQHMELICRRALEVFQRHDGHRVGKVGQMLRSFIITPSVLTQNRFQTSSFLASFAGSETQKSQPSLRRLCAKVRGLPSGYACIQQFPHTWHRPGPHRQGHDHTQRLHGLARSHGHYPRPRSRLMALFT